MAVEPQPQNSPSNSGDGTAFILAAIDRVAADSRSNYEQLAAEMRRSHDQLAADSRSVNGGAIMYLEGGSTA